ncbi:CRISPR-associated CARF protein Csx1 [Caldicellulosiruptor morganii]|uniref:CRISPR-associated CARF protein Csx1 n=1 Tax=Caldicellulosiruptor morganii TaxID=1387555 RepID=A0ABY7BLK8_9FIRM|nr:CRISPR-associated CARF protein Csx1 [Caldicellulosiruptor morganii]WAM33723.1 CRISPR-associated CARF protein Csx1 [Caldicellulosiruptor morganii]
MKLIYQLGRLDSNMEPQKFKFVDEDEKNCIEAELSSLYLKKYFNSVKNEQTEVVLLYPVSLPFNPTLLKNNSKLDDICKKKIEEIWEKEDEYFRNPRGFFENYFPYGKEKDDFIVIHSMGRYLYGKDGENTKEVRFDTAYGDIVLEIFLDMLKRYLEKESLIEEIYIDISSGHNIYISAMLEALRHFATFANLRHWINKERRPGLFVTICDPILPGNKNVYQVYSEKQMFIVFFESPLKSNDLNEIYKKLSEIELENLKDQVEAILNRFLLIFSSIKNNTPLYLFDTETEIDEADEVKELLKNIINNMYSKIVKSYKESPKLNKNLWIKMLNTLGFYLGIIDTIKNLEISKYQKQKGISIEDLEDKAGKMYKIFGLKNHIDILKVELDRLEISDEKDKLNYIKISNKKEQQEQRNFFAHCGFEKKFIWVEWVEEKEKKNNVRYLKYVRYLDDSPELRLREIIKEFLLKRV